MSPELLNPDSGFLSKVKEVFAEIKKAAPECDGITISGGEPFDQAAPLAELCKLVKSCTCLDVMVYSGYTINEIKAGARDMNLLLETADMLIDGEYRQELPTRKFWRGSDNQNLYLLTPGAQKYQKYVNAEDNQDRQLQFQITPDVQIIIIGIPARGFFDKFESLIEKRGIQIKRGRQL
jgi:anaerobic ribonucleoside-triphosphate reductase activating protein